MKQKQKLAIAGIAASSLLLAGCASGDGGSPSGEGELIVGSFGGDYDRFLQASVDPEFQERMPDTQITYSSGDPNALVTRLTAEQNAEVGSFDIVQLAIQDQAPLQEAGVFEELDPGLIDRWDEIMPSVANDYCIPHIQSPISIIYNTDIVTDEPTDWDDFFAPEFLDRSGVWGTLWAPYVWYGAAVDAAGGDPGEDWSVGYDQAEEAASTLADFGSTEQVGQALISGEIQAVAGPKARAAMWNETSGGSVSSVVPESGTFSYVSVTCIPANAPNKEAAYEYLNAELTDSAQLYFAEHMKYAPTVSSVELPEDLVEEVGVTDEEAERIYPVDWVAQNEPSSERRDLWSRAVGQ